MASVIPDRVMLWTLEEDFGDPEYFGKIDVRGASTLEALRFTLESNDVLEWSFDFWDAEDKCRVRKRLERLNSFSGSVYVIWLGEVEVDAQKRWRLGNGSFEASGDMYDAPAVEGVEVLQVNANEEDATNLAAGSSWVSGIADSTEADKNLLRSELLPNDIMDIYLERAKKLRAELKRVALDDHKWWLKSFDLNGRGVVKMWCDECKKDCGGGTKDHTKAQIDNLFNNFRRSHVVSTLHVRNYCAAKNINFEDHPQSQAKNGGAITLTAEDHRNLISEGVEILDRVNATLPEGQHKFRVLRNLTAENTRCYWFKVRCLYCRDLMVLYPPRKTLELNLQNHLSGLKHQKAVEDSQRSAKEPARTGRPGRPSKSTTTSSHSNQGDLHSWFMPSSSSGMTGITQSIDKSFIAGLMCYGFRGPTVQYGGLSYAVNALLNDRHCGVDWYSEPHLRATVHVQGIVVEITGAFRHKQCSRLSMCGDPFPNLTCPTCAHIPLLNDFRMRIKRKDQVVIKRGQRSTGGGIRLGYLSAYEVCKHTKKLSKRLRLEMLHYCHARRRIA